MSEINDLLKQAENLSKEKLVQIEREVKDIEVRIRELPMEIVGYKPLSSVTVLKESIRSSIEDLEEK